MSSHLYHCCFFCLFVVASEQEMIGHEENKISATAAGGL
jgi:hypothetical protein